MQDPKMQIFKAPAKDYPDIKLPIPQELNPADEKLIRIQREFRMRLRNSPYHIRSNHIQKDIERYSDKYNQPKNVGVDIFQAIPTNPAFFPGELFPPKGKAKTKSSKKKKTVTINLDLATLAELEKKEEEEEGEEKKEGEEEAEELEEGFSEEDDEEETDYNSSYFDNGEDYGDTEDADEGAVY